MFSDITTHWIAIVGLLLVGLGLIAAVVIPYSRTRYTWAQAPFFLIHLIYTKIVWRGTISRPLPVKPGQGAIVVSNHVSPIDPAFIQLGMDEIVHWMVAREYSLNPYMAWVFRITKSIPVNRRGIDTAATKMAIRYAREGHVVGIFPEGHINPHPEEKLLLPGRPGAALVALKARVPLIPCYIKGAPYDGTAYGCFLMTARTRCEVGDPIDISEYYGRENEREVLIAITERVMREIARLAGFPDYVPEMAGRKWNHEQFAPQQVPAQ